MPQIVEQFRTQYSILQNADADNASGRLVTILDWLCNEPLTKDILDKLTTTVDEAKIFPAFTRRARIAAHTREEIAFAGSTPLSITNKNRTAVAKPKRSNAPRSNFFTKTQRFSGNRKKGLTFNLIES